jgi:O-antigen/teichoic acid export membrane protein
MTPSVQASGGFKTDTKWALLTYAMRAGSSLMFVLVVSTRLGSSRFGSFAALSALTSLAGIVVSNAVSHALTRRAARDVSGIEDCLDLGSSTVILNAVCVLVPYLALSQLLQGIGVWAALALYVADVVVGGLFEVVAGVHTGRRDFRIATFALGAGATGRAAAALGVLTAGQASIASVCLWASIGSIVAAVAFFTGLRSRWAPRPSLRGAVPLLMESRIFLFGNTVSRVSNDFDKFYLAARLGAVGDVGNYAIGYRITEYSALPLAALSASAYPRMFAAGSEGIAPAQQFARRIAPLYLAAGAATTVFLLAASRLVPEMLGDDYRGASTVIAALALLPLIRACSNVFAEPLTGSNFHAHRVGILSIGTAANVVTNVLLVSRIGWGAAVAATYIAEILQLACFIIAGSKLRGRAAAEPAL